MWEWGEYKSFDAATGFNHANYVLQALEDYECITNDPSIHNARMFTRMIVNIGLKLHYNQD